MAPAFPISWSRRAPSPPDPRPERSIVFLAVTAEEKGLLGFEYYAANPLYPLGKTVGVINTDFMGVFGPARDFSISGTAKLGLLDDLVEEGSQATAATSPPTRIRRAAASTVPTISRWPRPASRPSASSRAPDLVNGGTARGEAISADYTAKRYHQPDDEWSPDWDFTGMVKDAELLHARRPAPGQFARMAELERGQRIPRRPRRFCGRAAGCTKAGQARRAGMIAAKL